MTPPTWPPRWEVFLDAEAEVPWFEFASYVAALDAEEAAATDLAELAAHTADSHDQLSPAHLEKHQPPSASVTPCYLRDSGGLSAPTVAAHGA